MKEKFKVMDENLKQAIEELYEAFSEVPKPKKIVGCPCCSTEQELRYLLEVDLRSISVANFLFYLDSAIYTVGTERDFVYFLPRILEIFVNEETDFSTIESIGSRINMTKPRSWISHRQEALNNLFHSKLKTWDVDNNNFDIDE